MYEIRMMNCNNIEHGIIKIQKNKLNIKYGINGTGKTTLSKGISCVNDNTELQLLKTYYSKNAAEVSITPELSKVLVFDEKFVKQVVFKDNEVIGNSFEIFLKTPNYDEKKQLIDTRLIALKKIMKENPEIMELYNSLVKVNEKFKRTTTGGISKTGTFKSLLSKQNIYNVPAELESYKPFFENRDINIPWIDWKNKGEVYDKESN